MEDVAAPPADTNTQGAESPRHTPAVTVVLVAHHPGEWFDETLASIAAADYPRLRTVVINVDNDPTVTTRVNAYLPSARLVPISGGTKFAAAANQVLSMPNPTPLLLLCHDDVAFSPDAVRIMVDEALRSNAGIVGPKIVDWDHPSHLLEVGLGVDKTGVISNLVEPGEVDQEQHDAVRDVFAVSSTAMLIRFDLFKALGGFDSMMTARGEDVDLCWRARIAGARILVAPDAVVRHRETESRASDPAERRRLTTRNQVRMIMTNYGPTQRVLVLPQAAAAAGASTIYAVSRGRLDHAGATVKGWASETTNFRRNRQRRRRNSRVRQIGDREVRRSQTRGFEQLNRLLGANSDEALSPTMRWRERVGLVAGSMAGQILIGVWVLTAAVILFGSRGLFSGGVPVFRQFVEFPESLGALWSEWYRGARGTGLTAETYAPTLQAVAGISGLLSFGQLGFARTMLIVGMLPIGGIGMLRLVSPFDSRVARMFAPWIYLALPVPYNAMVNGTWSGLVLWAALPWVVRWLCRAADVVPYGLGSSVPSIRSIMGAGLVVAALGAFSPFFAMSIAIVFVGWMIGTLTLGRTDSIVAMGLAVLGAIVVAIVVNGPWWVPSVIHGGWNFVAGDGYLHGEPLSLVQLMRFQTGPNGTGWSAWGIHVIALLGLLLAQGDRLLWAIRGWMIAVLSLAVAWFTEMGYLGIRMPAREVLLAPAALGLAIPAVMALIAFERDLSSYRFGYRQVLPVVAFVALLVVGVSRVDASIGGRWGVAEGGFETAVRFMDDGEQDVSRILWVGAPGVLPVGGWDYADSVVSVTDPHTPSLVDRWSSPDADGQAALASVLDVANNGGTNRLGRLLAPFGIRYVVGVEQTAPAPFGHDRVPLPSRVEYSLLEQLDLERIEARDGLVVYRNDSWMPMVSILPGGAATDVVSLLEPEVASGATTDAATNTFRSDGPLAWSSAVDPDTEVYVGTDSSSNWRVSVNDRASLRQPGFGWANAFSNAESGVAQVTFSTPLSYRLVMLGQLLVALVLFVVVATRRFRRHGS